MSMDLANQPPSPNDAVDILSTLHRYINTEGKMELSTFDPESDDGADMLVAATITDVPDLSSLANVQISVRHFMMHEASRESDGGEVDTWTRIIIFDDKGKPFSCGSLGVRKCLEVMLRIRKAKLFDPPVKCTVKVDRIDGGAKQWMTLVPDMDSLKDRKGKRK